jgi:hypothetical protein
MITNILNYLHLPHYITEFMYFQLLLSLSFIAIFVSIILFIIMFYFYIICIYFSYMLTIAFTNNGINHEGLKHYKTF